MRFGKKKKDDRPAQQQVRSQKGPTSAIQLRPNSGSDGLPGSAGYPDGPKTELPTFFLMERPDGKPERVPKKKGFFG